MVSVERHGQDYLHLKWHVACSGLATPDLNHYLRRNRIYYFGAFRSDFVSCVGIPVGMGLFINCHFLFEVQLFVLEFTY